MGILRKILSFETRLESTDRVKESAAAKSCASLPSVLQGAVEVQRQLVAVVTSKGGGWAIPSWSNPEFIAEVIHHHLDPVSATLSPAQQFLSEKSKNSYCGTWLIKLYVKAMSSNFTEAMVRSLEESTALLESMSTSRVNRKKNWDNFLQSSPGVWAAVTDSFVVFKFWKWKVRPTPRRRAKQLDGVLVPTLPSKGLLLKALLARTIGQWAYGSPVISGGDLETLVKKFDAGFIPIGHVFITIRGGHRYHGRTVELQQALTFLTISAVKNSLIKTEMVTSFFFPFHLV